MKLNILKTIAVCTMALSLLIAGLAAVNSVDTGVAVCHDGPIHHVITY